MLNRDVMTKNLASAGPSVCAKHLMRKLAQLAGRGQAHDIVHYALESGETDALCTDSNITALFSETQIETALDLPHITGLTPTASIQQPASDYKHGVLNLI